MDRRQHQVTAAVFAAVLAVMTILCVVTLIQPARAKSELENRILAQRPAFPSGIHGFSRFAKNWDSYVLDQVPFREFWVHSYYRLQVRALGKSEMNGVVVGKHGYLFTSPVAPATSEKQLKGRIERAVTQVAGFDKCIRAYGGHLLYALVPGKGSLFPGYYPFFAPYPPLIDQAEEQFLAALQKEGLDGLTLRTTLQANRDKQLYYQTDHHWTFAGAFLGYSAIMDRLGLPAMKVDDLEVTTLPNPFLGSRNRSLGMAIPNRDAFSVGLPRDPVDYDLTVNGKAVQTGSRYTRLPSDTSDPVAYSSVFPYANSAEVLLDTHRPDLPDLLVVGDSFKGAIDGLFIPSFNQIRQVDLRSYSAMSMTDYVEKYKPDYVVVLLSGSSFIQAPWNVFDKPSKGDFME